MLYVEFQQRNQARTGKSDLKKTIAALLCVLTVASLNLTSCVAWTTNSQGQLQSLGVPGLPIWQTQTLTEQKHLAAEGELAAAPGSEVDSGAAKLTSLQSDSPWLADVNRWRMKAGVDPVGENTGLSNAGAAHACYLVKNRPSTPAAFFNYEQTIGGAAHTEDFSNQYFTQSGYEAALRGDISWDRGAEADVDALVEAPFHRLSILAPWMRVAGYGDCGRWPMRAATLVLRGSTPVGLTKPIVFPPDGSVVPGTMKKSEWPSPLAACPGYTFPVGTPITVQMVAAIKVSLESESIEDETASRQVDACAFDATTCPDQWGQRALLAYGAVVVIPRKPLTPGHSDSVSVKMQRHAFSWRFQVSQDRVLQDRSS
jgi:hypothetical protein